MNISNIYRWELEKLYQMPVFYVLVIMCIAWNCYLFWDAKGYHIEEIRYDVSYMQENPEGFAKDYYVDYYAIFDIHKIQQYSKAETDYDAFMDKNIEKNYAKLKVRIENMSDEERNSVMFTGNYKLHPFLFGDFLRWLLLEGMLLIGLTVLYSMHFEKYHRTEELMLVTKTGKDLFRIKLFVSGLFALLLSGLVLSVSLGIYFISINYSSVWNSYISSNYNAGARIINDLYRTVYPYVTWVPMTVGQYLLAALGIVFLLFLFMMLLIGMLSYWLNHSVKVVCVFIIFSFLLYILGNEIALPNAMEYVLKCNPVHLILKSGYWFMDYAPGDSYPLYELLTVVLWIGFAGGGLRVVWKKA